MRPLSAPLLALSLPLAACGGGRPAGDAGRLERPALVALTDSELPGERVERLEVPGELGEWTVVGRPATTRARSDGTTVVRIAAGEEPAVLTVPGRYRADTVDLVRVAGRFPGVYRLTVVLTGEGIEPFRTVSLTSRNSRSDQALTFDLIKLKERKETFGRLLVYLDGPARTLEVGTIEVVTIPTWARLPAPGSPPEIVDLENGVGRPAIGLTPPLPIGCTVRVEDAQDRLGFAVALAPQLRPSRGSGTVTVRVALAGEVQRAEVVTLGRDRQEWFEGEIPLGRWAGQEVDVRFEYSCDAPEPGACLVADVRVHRPRRDPPTVVLVSSDTHRGDHVQAAGLGVDVETPSIDGLAEEGLFFEHCWSTTNVTSPSHVAMLTGVHPRDTRLVTNIDRLAPEAVTLAEVFQDAGWATLAAVSVRHLGPRGTNLGQGFDRILAPLSEPWDASVPVDRLRTWMDEYAGLPLFVFLHVFDAHHPYAPPEDYGQRYWPADRDPADQSLPPLDVPPGALPQDLVAAGVRDLGFPRAQYKGEISYLDAQLGRLLEVERVRRGVVAVTADHGEILEKDGTFFNHGELFPDTLHVPLVIGGGALPADVRGERVAHPVRQLDLPRTLLDLAGLGATDFPGRSLLAHVEGAPERGDGAGGEPIFALAAHGNSASIRSGRWFLLLHLRDHKGKLARARAKHELELYDLARDPQCLANVAETNPDVAADLRERLVEWLSQADPVGLAMRRVASAREIADLAALGYAADSETVEEEPWYEPE